MLYLPENLKKYRILKMIYSFSLVIRIMLHFIKALVPVQEKPENRQRTHRHMKCI